MAKKPIRVVPNHESKTSPREGNWKVKTGRFAKSSTHNKKSRAIKRAKQLARKHFRGITVHNKDGQVAYGFTVKQKAPWAKPRLIRS